MGRDLRSTWIALVALMLVALLAAVAAAGPSRAAKIETATVATKSERANLRKIEAETDRAEAETEKLEADEEWWSPSFLGPLLAALAAVGGLFLSAWKFGKDRRDAIDRETRGREQAREASEIERFDERFAKAVTGLSSAQPGEEVGAAVLVSSMVREKREALSSQALQLLLVSLQAPHNEVCERLLRFALERFARAAPERLIKSDDGEASLGLVHVRASYLNLSHLQLPGLDLAFASLRKADFRGAGLAGCLAYGAELEKAVFNGADLTGAQWVDAKAPDAKFRKANLSDARLHQAKLDGAKFYRANLSGANLRMASLTGAEFKRANLSGADFHGATLDERALLSILHSEDWSLAEFSGPIEAQLDELARKQERAPGSLGTARGGATDPAPASAS